MSISNYGPIFEELISFAQDIIEFFNYFFDFLTVNLWEQISNADLPSWLVGALDSVDLDAFLSQYSIFTVLFSYAIVLIIIVKFFIR